MWMIIKKGMEEKVVEGNRKEVFKKQINELRNMIFLGRKENVVCKKRVVRFIEVIFVEENVLRRMKLKQKEDYNEEVNGEE